MPNPRTLRFALLLILVSASGFQIFAANTVLPSTTVTITGTSTTETLTQGKTFVFTKGGGSDITLLPQAAFIFQARGSDKSASDALDVRIDVRDIAKTNDAFKPGQTYEGTIGQAGGGAPPGPYLSASLNGRGCNDDKNTKGRFEVEDYKWQSVYYPKGSVERDPASKDFGRVRIHDEFVSFAITHMKVNFELHCNGESPLAMGTVDYAEQANTNVPTDAIEVIGPTDACYSFGLVGTGGPCAGSAGTGGGGGGTTGGGVFPTLPPLPPPGDVTVNFPTSIFGDSGPFIQLSNNGSTSFKFTTTPVNSTINSDVTLQVESDASEGDNFNVSITPNFIPAPGAGEATVNIGVGPNTLPRDYHVTVTAFANGKFSSATFTVNVACDPPQILGVDQPQNQRVRSGTPATVSVKATGSGPFAYQWYRGRRGNTRSPISGATNPSFTTPAVTGDDSYWVRVSNACGSVDSNSVSVATQ